MPLLEIVPQPVESGGIVSLADSAPESQRVHQPRQVAARPALRAYHPTSPPNSRGMRLKLPEPRWSSCRLSSRSYNQGSYLLGAVESVHAVGIPELEVVVVDDGSTEPGDRRLSSTTSPGVTKVRQVNAGLSAALHAGIAAAAGHYIVPLTLMT